MCDRLLEPDRADAAYFLSLKHKTPRSSIPPVSGGRPGLRSTASGPGTATAPVEAGSNPQCGGTVKVIASIEDLPIIERILRHLAGKDLSGLWPQSRAARIR